MNFCAHNKLILNCFRLKQLRHTNPFYLRLTPFLWARTPNKLERQALAKKKYLHTGFELKTAGPYEQGLSNPLQWPDYDDMIPNLLVLG